MISTPFETLSSHTPLAAERRRLPTVGRMAGLLQRAAKAVWEGLEDVGQARASRELRRVADHYAISDPQLAKQILAASAYDSTSRAAARAASAAGPLPARGAARAS